MPRLTSLVAPVVLMVACASSPSPAPPSPAPADGTLFVGPRFDVPGGSARAIRVVDGKVAEILAEVPAAGATSSAVVTLPGALALPGLIDAHLHVAWIGKSKEQLDLDGVASIKEVNQRLATFATAHPDVRVLIGNGWDHTRWGGRDAAFPTADDLVTRTVDDRPVVLNRVDGHAVWLNRAAIARVADFFAAPPASSAMRIERDAAGHPTGVIVDPVKAFWDLMLPAETDAELERWLSNGLAACADVGLVEVHDMATSPAELAALQRLAARGALPVRVVVYLDGSETSFAWLAAHPSGPPAVLCPDLMVAGVKLFADGALGSRGAALKDDYSDMHGHRGLPTGLDALRAAAVRAAGLGYPVAIHAIGDLGNEHALTAIEAALAVRPGLRHRVEHAQVLDLADLDRFVAGGIVASMQPTHAVSDMRWAEARVGPERIKGAYAWNTILHRGIALAFGSDAPVERQDPLLGLYAALFRQTAAGDPPGGWRPSEALTWDEALAAFTTGAVFAAPGQGRSGALTIGAPFDVTLVDRDVAATPRELVHAAVLATVRGGDLRSVSPP